MYFRRKADHQVSWSRFVDLYRSRLSSLGIPDVVFRSERSWNYFIEHLYDHEYPELLNLDDWSPDDLRPLLQVFEELRKDGFYAGGSGGVLSSLRCRFIDPEVSKREDALIEATSIVANADSSVPALMMASHTICESDDATLEDLIDCAALSFRSAAWRAAIP